MMFKRITVTTLLAIVLSVAFLVPVYATPPANPYFTTGTADAAGYYMEYYSNGSWKDLKTPQHWEKNTKDIAYCLNQTMLLPTGTQIYSRFNPESMYSATTLKGLYSILGYGYPNTTGGLPNDMARYATSNAIRAWLKESEGIGYNFMDVGNGLIRAKSNSPWAYSWMLGLLGLARRGESPLDWSNRSISISPSVVELNAKGDTLSGTFTISCPASSYTIDDSKLPSGFTISGYTGKSGDTLTISGPISYTGGKITLENLFTGMDTLSIDNISWYTCTNNYQPMVCVDFSKPRAVLTGSLTIEPNLGGYARIKKMDDETNEPLEGAVFALYDTEDNLIAELATDEQGIAISSLLDEGDYVLVETAAPTGYLIDTTRHDVTIPKDGTTVDMTLFNTQIKGYVELIKIGEADNPLEGADYGVYAEADDRLVCELMTDQNGYAISPLIPYGAYYLKETAAPLMYNLNDETIPFFIDKHGETVSIKASDTLIRGQVEIFKVGETDNPLSDVIYGIYDKDNTLTEEIVTNAQGMALSSPLVYGDYILKEVKALEGYNINEEPLPFEIRNEGEVITLSAVNTLIRGSIKIIKTSAQDGAPIKGVVFSILSSGGEFIEELFTDETGMAISNTLFYGDYYLQEKSVPKGFVLEETRIPFSILTNGEIIKKVQNAPVKGTVVVLYRHIRTKHELNDAYLFTDWVGEDYMAWLEATGLDNMNIAGYTLVKSDYPKEEALQNGKLTVTYWYDDKINGEWCDVYIPKTGQTPPLLMYILSALFFIFAMLFISFYTKGKSSKA